MEEDFKKILKKYNKTFIKFSKKINALEDRVAELELKARLLENNVNHLETLLRLKDKVPERPFYPNPTIPTSPWYHEPTLTPPYKITCSTDKGQIKELEDDPFCKLLIDTFGL